MFGAAGAPFWAGGALERGERTTVPILVCPNCEEGMREVRRNDVLIDVCPKCRGVWLDRGELEKLLETARAVDAEYERALSRYQEARPPGYGAPPHHGYGKGYRKKKKSLFELFDFDFFD